MLPKLQYLAKVPINQVWLNLRPVLCNFRVTLVRQLFFCNWCWNLQWFYIRQNCFPQYHVIFIWLVSIRICVLFKDEKYALGAKPAPLLGSQFFSVGILPQICDCCGNEYLKFNIYERHVNAVHLLTNMNRTLDQYTWYNTLQCTLSNWHIYS